MDYYDEQVYELLDQLQKRVQEAKNHTPSNNNAQYYFYMEMLVWIYRSKRWMDTAVPEDE